MDKMKANDAADGSAQRNPQSHKDNLFAGQMISQGHPKSAPVPIHAGCHGRDDHSADQ